MKYKKINLILLIITILWTMLIFSFSSQDGAASSEASGSVLDWIWELGIPVSEYLVRKTAHVFIYFVLGASSTAFGLSVLFHLEQWKYKGAIMIGIGYSFICACVDEWNQYHTVGRDGQFSDVGVDAIGFIAGSFLLVWGIEYVMRLQEKKKEVYEIEE